MEINAASPWSTQAGNLALNFANTADWHTSQNPQELLNSYTDLLNWSQDYDLLVRAEVARLQSDAELAPGEAARSLKRAIALRESMFGVFSAVAHDKLPSEHDLDRIKKTLAEAVSAARIIPQELGFGWEWSFKPGAFEQMVWPVSQAALDLLLSKKISQVGQCADQRGCGFLFIDTSRNHSRNWCRMETCGNRAKARRHYKRIKN
ncbi:MAG: CGNR zinc finger domain-containing protein [Anaerolineae bacterium]|nr:CGNR zinc finger domain-containing protein [Anaerolineae bacterium]